MKTQSDAIKVLIFKDNDLFIAQCLEYDIAVQGETLKELEERLVCTLLDYVALSIENREPPFSHVPRTPKEFWDLFKKANRLEKPLRIPSPPRRKINGRYIREYVPKHALMAISEPPHDKTKKRETHVGNVC